MLRADPSFADQFDEVYGAGSARFYLNQSVGIGEHSDIVEAIQEELDKMASANDRIEMLDIYFDEDYTT